MSLNHVSISSLAVFAALTCAIAACSEGEDDPVGSASGGVPGGGGAATGGSGTGGDTTNTTTTNSATTNSATTNSATTNSATTNSATTNSATTNTAAGTDTTTNTATTNTTPGTDADFTFDTDLEGFAISFSDPADFGTLTHNTTAGDPAPGSLQLEAPYSAPDQKVAVAWNPDAPLDLSGVIVTARVQLVSGLGTDPSNPGGAKLFVKSGEDYVYADGGWYNLDTTGTWIDIGITVDDPEGYIDTAAGTFDPTQITEIGVEIASGGDGTYTDAVVLIDSIDY